MKRKITFLIFICPLLYGQRADFFKENITFHLDSIYFSVEGYYWFSNNSNKSNYADIFYPFPNYSDEKIDSINVFNVSAEREIKFIKEGIHGISFNLFIESFDTVLFQIRYRQRLNSDSAVYILRTTQGWDKPLISAVYNLIVSKSFEIKKFIYPPVKSYQIGNKNIYIWRMRNFMPLRDMIFHF